MPRTRLYREGILQRENFDAAEVSDLLQDPANTVWLDFDSPTARDLAMIAEELSIHPLAVEDAVHQHQRAKLDRYETHLFLSAYALGLPSGDHADLRKYAIDAFITKGALVTVRKHGEFDMTKVLERWDAHPGLTAHGVGSLVWGLLDVIVDTHFDTVQGLDDNVNALEEAVFEEKPNTVAIQRDAYTMHKHIVTMRRLALPMREITTEFMRVASDIVRDEGLMPYYQDVYDHTMRVADWTDSLRDLVSTIIDTNLTAQGNRMNLVMKKVTSWAAIIAVPTLVTGFYGMNVRYPLINTVTGYWVSIALMVVASAVLYWRFRKNDWL